MPKNLGNSPDKIAASSLLPEVSYLPRDPVSLKPGIGLVGCGGISGDHLTAYRDAGYRVLALADVDLEAARQRCDEFFPDATVYRDYRQLLELDNVEVVDVATHVDVRPSIVEDCLRAKRHVLSQKPFILDLEEGQRLAKLADEYGVLLAVNQNARWAPHFSYMREATSAGLIGDVLAVRCQAHWDHSWVAGTPFEHVPHLLLCDYGIHWFDFIQSVWQDEQPISVYAKTLRSPAQAIDAPLFAHVVIDYKNVQASLVFDGTTRHGGFQQTTVIGSTGSLRSVGPDSNQQSVELTVAGGVIRPQLQGQWFPDGFHGTMGELLCATEEKREPTISARRNLDSLRLCFAAAESAARGEPVRPQEVRGLPS